MDWLSVYGLIECRGSLCVVDPPALMSQGSSSREGTRSRSQGKGLFLYKYNWITYLVQRPSFLYFCWLSIPCINNSIGEKIMAHISARSVRNQVLTISCCACQSLCIWSYCTEQYTAVDLVDSLKGVKRPQ